MTHTLRTLAHALEGRYALQQEIGSGGMAVVFAASDLRHGRRVAIKVIREDLAEGEGLDRFLREIGVTARLNHPHILPLLDSGEVARMPYYVMPFIEGETLRHRLDRERRLAVGDALDIAADIADALAYAHAQDVLHRDVKPENIMFSGRHALVADFGIAKAMQLAAGDENVTQSGHIVGTPAYMSPEQSAGDETIDARSDVYSLGVVMYEMLTGETPFSGPSSRSVFARRLTEDVPALRTLQPEIPPIVDHVVLRALAREPADRHASAAEFADALSHTRRAVSSVGSNVMQLSADLPVMPSIAILPFANLSSDPENEYLSDGITEEILNALSRLRSIRVCARASSFAFKGQSVDIRNVGERLGVRSVLTGSVRRSGPRLRVSAQLVNAVDGFQLWSERYERTSDDIFAIEDDISSAIVRALRSALGGDQRAAGGAALTSPRIEAAASSAAHEHVLKGRYLLARRTEESVRQAMTEFQLAVGTDQGYAAAHAGLADAWALLAVYGAVEPGVAMPAARAAAERALLLQPANAEAQATLGTILAVFEWRWEEAALAFAAASERNSRYAPAHQWLATNVHVPHQRFDEALEAVGRAMRLDPLSVAVKTAWISVLFYSRRYAEALDAARDLAATEPSSVLSHYFAGQTLLELGDLAGARESLQNAVVRSGESSETVAALAYAYARDGEVARARDLLGQLQRRRSADRHVPATHLALIHLGLGDPSAALDDLERAREERASDLVWLRVRPAWDALRGSPRFDSILRSLDLA
ncbi:MAG: Serine/threonine-protein kinase PknD [Gemmatimonadaceae bacterium]|nr:Serine/threonine-protein kinase PknD [Gemmatimonadaceae bacterium]